MDDLEKSGGSKDWQSFLDEITIKAKSLGEVNKVKSCISLRGKVEVCYNTKYIHNGLKEWIRLCLKRPIVEKRSSTAEKFRVKGNEYIKNNNKLLALSCYNKSIFYAPKDSDELRSAYGNRSYVLIEMKHYRECIQDIDKALDGCDFGLRQLKLFSRKAQALIALGKYSEAIQILEKTLSLSEKFSVDLKRKSRKSLSEINLLLEKIKVEKKYLISSKEEASFVMEPSLKFIENKNFRNASKFINLVQSESKGRYVIANENIKVGDVLFSERPFAFVVLPEMADKYCSYCCKTVYAPFPCVNCPLACFCNESCRTLAQESFHKWECGGLEICYSIGIVHLGLRVTLLGLSGKKKEEYEEVKNLVSHVNKSTPADLFSYTVTAALLTVYLEDYTNLFDGPGRRDKLLDLGGILLLHITQLICNGHAITDIESECDPDTSLLIENQVRVATGIYPSASMMNHSCDPTIINSFFENLLIVRASKDLKKGDEVFNCYGPMVQKMDYEERHELLLSQYMFDCDCEGCKKKIGPISNSIICESCSSSLIFGQKVCPSCSKNVNIQALKTDINTARNLFNDGLKLLNDREFTHSCECFKKSLSLYQRHCHANHQKVLECRDCLARANANIGTEEEAYKYIIQNIACIEDMYGKYAVEVGQEILKLLTVATILSDKNDKRAIKNRKILEECIELGKRGKFILEMSYGDWHPRYKDFCKHLDYLLLCTSI